jgi:transposase
VEECGPQEHAISFRAGPRAGIVESRFGVGIPSDHLVRKIAAWVDKAELSPLISSYKFKGGRPYQPRPMLAVLLYGMTEGVRSERELEEHCKYDQRYRFLNDGHTPDDRTFGRFIDRVGPFVDDILSEVLKEARSQGMAKAHEVAVDGCKVPANTSWWDHRKESTKTPSDPDARLMVSHGRPIVGYNVQIALDTADDIIVGAEVTNKEVDWHVAAQVMETTEQQLGELPCAMVADSGYESSSSIEELGEMGIDTVIAPREGLTEHLRLDENYELVCPIGKPIVFVGESPRKDGRIVANFRPEGGCARCPRVKDCGFKGKRLQLTPGDDPSAKFRNKDRVESDKYQGALIRRRSVERPFASLRCHDNFGRFHRRTLRKVRVEFLLWVISYDLRVLLKLFIRIFPLIFATLKAIFMQLSSETSRRISRLQLNAILER